MLPSHYWLTNAHVPAALMAQGQQGATEDWATVTPNRDDLLHLNIEINDGSIARIVPVGSVGEYDAPAIDLQDGMVFPCFVDLHAHLDKGQVWERAINPDGTFDSALVAIKTDAERFWDAEDLYRRIQFGLKCSYTHGTKALRTHLDSFGQQGTVGFEVFKTLRQEWADRLQMQAVCLVSLDYFLTPAGESLADLVAEAGGILGGFAVMNPEIEAQIDRTFTLAKERNLNLDFHTDETSDPDSIVLNLVARATLKHDYQGRVICGHCCSLAVQEPQAANATIQLVKQAGIGIVSLPMCNLYLQDRQPGRTPRWRGVTLVQELKQAGVPVAIASDNCRDPFHAFGDHDALEVFAMSVKIAQLDRPYGNWCSAITSTPADLMGLPTTGRIGVGLPADLLLFRARRYSELLSRPQSDRQVLRNGQAIDTTLPDYAELDEVLDRS
jgi:cytosine deaminase